MPRTDHRHPEVTVDATELVPMLPAALVLAVVTGGTKVLTGRYAARRDGVGQRGQLRAGTALVTRGEFSLVILGLAGAADGRLGASPRGPRSKHAQTRAP